MLHYVCYKLPKEEDTAMAPLQKRALYGLVFGIAWATAMAAIFFIKGGASAFDEDVGFRLIIDGLWIGGLIVYLVVFATITRRPAKFDERDRTILDRSARAQWMAVIFSLVAWVVGLSEIYHAEGQVPIIFLYLIFIYTLVVSSIAQCLGILLGYWRINRNG
jgi:hypothetical protein